jgi:hypothetical protein
MNQILPSGSASICQTDADGKHLVSIGEADLQLFALLNVDWSEIYYGDFQPVKQASRRQGNKRIPDAY